MTEITYIREPGKSGNEPQKDDTFNERDLTFFTEGESGAEGSGTPTGKNPHETKKIEDEGESKNEAKNPKEKDKDITPEEASLAGLRSGYRNWYLAAALLAVGGGAYLTKDYWAGSGEKEPNPIDELKSTVEALDGKVEKNEKSILELAKALSTERTERVSADEGLTDTINSESATRAAEDEKFRADIGAINKTLAKHDGSLKDLAKSAGTFKKSLEQFAALQAEVGTLRAELDSVRTKLDPKFVDALDKQLLWLSESVIRNNGDMIKAKQDIDNVKKAFTALVKDLSD